MIAAWLAIPPKLRKSCDKCKQLLDPSAFGQDVQFSVGNLVDCEQCEVTRAQPNSDNEIILELYSLLPENFDGWTGFKVITVSDVLGLFDMFDIPEELRDDYYMRLMYFHEAMIDARQKRTEKTKLEKEPDRSWKKKGRSGLPVSNH